MFECNSKQCYTTGKDATIDKMLVAYWGHCRFKQKNNKMQLTKDQQNCNSDKYTTCSFQKYEKKVTLVLTHVKNANMQFILC